MDVFSPGNMIQESTHEPRRMLIFPFLLVLHGCDLHDWIGPQSLGGVFKEEVTYLTGHMTPCLLYHQCALWYIVEM